VDVRIIGATNADLPALARAGRFKEDLLDRLSFEVVHVPPLRDRGDDMLLLAGQFAAGMAHELGLARPPKFSAAARAALAAHPWPGNVRELKNVVERAVYRADGDVVEEIVFDPFARDEQPVMLPAPPSPAPAPAPPASAPAAPARPAQTLPEAVARLEIELVRQALAEARHNQRRAAERLGLTYHQFRGLYRKHAEGLGG
jgi:psp operon transcriptional activator